MNLLSQLSVAGGVSIVNIAVHALATTSVIQLARTMRQPANAPSFVFLVRVMIVTVTALMFAHLCEVCIWALAYSVFDVTAKTTGVSVIYFAFVNYTTLGYGDIVPVARWNILGPATAMNGILLFGWSTAVIFEILRRTIALSEPARPGSDGRTID